MDGQFGRDTADYSSATGPINVALAAGTVTGDSSVGTDTLRSVEFIVGTNSPDTYDASGFSSLSTNSGSTVTYDVTGTFNGFEGLGGDDIITGNGDTRVSFLSATSGVTVTLGPDGSGTATGDASVGMDTFISGVARIRGSNFVDTLTGSNNPAGTAEHFEGRGENDIINGGGGFDRAVYTNEDAAISVHLAAGQVVGGVNTGTDTLLSVESIIGTDFSDTYDATGFSGSSTNAGSNGTFNEFEGRGGNDTIIGNGNTRVAFYSATDGVTVTLGVGRSLDREHQPAMPPSAPTPSTASTPCGALHLTTSSQAMTEGIRSTAVPAPMLSTALAATIRSPSQFYFTKSMTHTRNLRD